MKSLTWRQIAIIVGVLATAALHLAAAFDPILFGPGERPDLTFTLNGVGYIVLLALFFLPIPFLQKQHKWIWWALFIYVILTIVAWIGIWVVLTVIINHQNFFGHDSLYGVPAKIIELILLYLLWKEKP